MLRQMVMSETYRQSSAVSRSRTRSATPATGGWRTKTVSGSTPSWCATTPWPVSGLLSGEIGGPSVKPYQPPGYWVFLNFPTRDCVADKGDNQYRRGLYTYWQRTFLHPSLLAFDASTREECVVQRPRSNTPLQALVLLNDPTYVEAARGLAARLIREGGADPAAGSTERFDWSFPAPRGRRRPLSS